MALMSNRRPITVLREDAGRQIVGDAIKKAVIAMDSAMAGENQEQDIATALKVVPGALSPSR